LTGWDGWATPCFVTLTLPTVLAGRARCPRLAAHRPDAIVVSLGLDAAETDLESPLRVTEVGYRAAGRLTAALAPTVLIQEGGYDLPTLGPLAVAALTGVAEA
jgi:acetoin utilization deacetylase AcuC-like enzyme